MSTAQPDGYLAQPASDEAGAVLVLHAWWGVNDTIKSFCDHLAESGFVAFAPDLYHGKVADKVDDARALGTELDANLEQARADIAEAVAYLTDRASESSKGLAVIGFSLGAYYALDLSITDPDAISSVVVFYGTWSGDYSASRAAYLGHFAESDAFEPGPDVDAMEAALREAGRPVHFYKYPGAGHWFYEPDRTDAFDEAAASLAWDRTLAFLRAGTVL